MNRIFVSFIRIKIIICVLVLSILFSCSMPRILYNNADFLVINWFDAYFELNDQQHSDLKNGVKKLFKWHRESELPRVVLFLGELRLRYEKGLKEEDIDWTRAQFKDFWVRILNHIEGDLASLLLTIEDSQVFKMESKLLEGDDWLVKQSG